jgi:hypothetical protein
MFVAWPRSDKHNFRELRMPPLDVRYHFRDIAELIQFTGGSPISINSLVSAPFPNTALFGSTNACDGHMRYAGMAMSILSIKHVTSYRYRRPVAFGEHRMMLRPRDDDDQRLLQSDLEITPKPRELAWGRDGFGNHVGIAHFADRSDELRFASTVHLEYAPNRFHEGAIEDYARIYPFSYIAED